MRSGPENIRCKIRDKHSQPSHAGKSKKTFDPAFPVSGKATLETRSELASAVAIAFVSLPLFNVIGVLRGNFWPMDWFSLGQGPGAPIFFFSGVGWCQNWA